MAILEFPDVSLADHSGLLAVGGDLDVSSLLLAYRSGIFPWPLSENEPILWFAPPKRALLFFDRFRIPRSLRKVMRRCPYTFRVDSVCEQVIKACASQPRSGQRGTWITQQMIAAYGAFHRAGYCHSIECFDHGQCIGGLYGVAVGVMFAGESMFHRQPDVSKLCLCYLVDYLRTRGAKWLDCQQITPLLALFGAEEVDRMDFMRLLDEAICDSRRLF